jgi:hypothetical protein
MEVFVVDDPEACEDKKRDDKTEELRPHGDKVFWQFGSGLRFWDGRYVKTHDKQGHGKGEHAVNQCLEPVF